MPLDLLMMVIVMAAVMSGVVINSIGWLPFLDGRARAESQNSRDGYNGKSSDFLMTRCKHLIQSANPA